MGQPISSPYKSNEDLYANLSNNSKEYYHSVIDDITDTNTRIHLEANISSNRIDRQEVSRTNNCFDEMDVNSTDYNFKNTMKDTGYINNNSFDLNTRCNLLLLFNQQVGFDMYNKEKGYNLYNYKEIKYEKVMNEDKTECSIYRQSTKYRGFGRNIVGSLKNLIYN